MATQNPATSAYDLTALKQVTSISFEDKYPAVNLLAALLRQIALNVNTVPRDVHTNAAILSRSKTAFDGIVQSMKTLDEAGDDNLADNFWDLFDGYTIAIPILEKILLNLPHATGALDKTKSQLPPATSTQEAITHIHIWIKERSDLKQVLEDLKVESLRNLSTEASSALVADYVAHRIKDDNSLMKSLNAFITESKLSNSQIIREKNAKKPSLNLVTEVKGLVSSMISTISQKPPSEELYGITVRAIMMAYIPFAVWAATTTPDDWKLFLRKADVWTSIKDLLTKVKAEIDKPAGTDFKFDFETVEKLLLNLKDIAVDTAKAMLQLIKLCAHIPRPYSGRVASLVKAIYSVDQFSRKDENKALREHRYGLKETMETTHTALTSVKTASYDLKTFSLKSAEYGSTRDIIKGIHSSNVQPLFTTFGITDKWAHHDTEFGNSVSTDEDHVKKAQEIIFTNAGS